MQFDLLMFSLFIITYNKRKLFYKPINFEFIIALTIV